MADFSIAAQVGQNAMAPQQGQSNMFNPMNMLQMQQTMQAMALQRAADARAAEQLALQRKQYGLTEESTRQSMGITAAAEERAKALHAPALDAAVAQATKAKREIADLNTADEAITFTATNPDWMTKYDSFRKEKPKLWTALNSLAEKQAAAEAAKIKGGRDALKQQFELNAELGDYMSAIAPTVRDQAAYNKWLAPLLRNNPEMSLPTEYSPENFKTAASIVDRMRQFKIVRLPSGEDAVFDPIHKKFVSTLTDQGTQPYNGPQPAAAATPKPATTTSAPTRPDAFGPVIENELVNRIPGARITGRGRTPERNAEVGGAQRSYHLTNDAIDAAPPAGMPMNVFAEQVRRELGPLGYTVIYGDAKHRDHVHIQPGPGMNAPRASMVAQAAPLPGMAPQAPMSQPGVGGAAPTNAMAANPLIAMQMARMMQPQNAMAAAAQPQAGPSGLAAPAPMPVASTNPYAQSPVTQIAGAKAEAEARGKAKVEGEKTEATKEANQQAFDTNLDTVLGAYRDLAQKGYLTTKETPFAERLATGVMANVPVGAATVVNPERGAAYADIANNRQIMLSALMGATGMTAKQIDSNAEMKNWLNALSAPDQEAGSVLRTLNALSKRFGTGRQFTREDMGLPPEGRGKAGETPPPRGGKPSLADFMAKAKPLNPNASEADLKAYYERTYGGR